MFSYMSRFIEDKLQCFFLRVVVLLSPGNILDLVFFFCKWRGEEVSHRGCVA